MEWQNNLTVSHLFLSHDVTLEGDGSYTIHIPSLREFVQTTFYTNFIQLFEAESLESWHKVIPDLTKIQLLHLLMTSPRITNLKEFSPLSHMLHQFMPKLLPDFNIQERQLYCKNSPITDDALTEILYILQLGIGRKVEKPQHFGPGEEAARRFYERAQAAKKKVQKIREEGSKSDDGLITMFTWILYKFPMYTYEQLYDMTIIQLHYLQSMASKMVGYEHGMTAYLTGNAKKAPEFFLK